MKTETISAGCNVTMDEIAELKSILGGKVLTEGESYESARKVWNGMIDRRPAVIIQCRNSDDVIKAMKFAKAHSLVVSVKGGGHNVAGNAVCEGLMIDLSKSGKSRLKSKNSCYAKK